MVSEGVSASESASASERFLVLRRVAILLARLRLGDEPRVEHLLPRGGGPYPPQSYRRRFVSRASHRVFGQSRRACPGRGRDDGREHREIESFSSVVPASRSRAASRARGCDAHRVPIGLEVSRAHGRRVPPQTATHRPHLERHLSPRAPRQRHLSERDARELSSLFFVFDANLGGSSTPRAHDDGEPMRLRARAFVAPVHLPRRVRAPTTRQRADTKRHRARLLQTIEDAPRGDVAPPVRRSPFGARVARRRRARVRDVPRGSARRRADRPSFEPRAEYEPSRERRRRANRRATPGLVLRAPHPPPTRDAFERRSRRERRRGDPPLARGDHRASPFAPRRSRAPRRRAPRHGRHRRRARVAFVGGVRTPRGGRSRERSNVGGVRDVRVLGAAKHGVGVHRAERRLESFAVPFHPRQTHEFRPRDDGGGAATPRVE